MLRLGPCVMRVGVGKDEHAPVALYDSGLAAHVARQTRVSRWIQVACAHASAFGIAGARRLLFGLVLDRSRTLSRDGIRDQSRVDRAVFPREDFLARHDAALDEQSLDRREPSFVIARREVARGRDPLDRMTELIVMYLRHAHRAGRQGIHSPSPVGVKDGFVLFADHRPETVHPAHVMYAVHRDSISFDSRVRLSRRLAVGTSARRTTTLMPSTFPLHLF